MTFSAHLIAARILALSAALAGPVAADVVYQNAGGLREVAFLSGWRMADGNHMAAVRIRLQDGWKTYWRAPGGTGIPAQFDWTGSRNLASVRFHWPAPTVYADDGQITVGYKDELVLPLEFTPDNPDTPIVISADLEFGICREVCVPATARIEATLPATARTETRAIARALAAAPVPARDAGITDITCALALTRDGFAITARFRTAANLSPAALTIFEYPHPDIWIADTTTVRAGRDITVTTILYAYGDTPVMLDRGKLRMTLMDQGRAVDIQGCPAG